jgi:hypothetical protein
MEEIPDDGVKVLILLGIAIVFFIILKMPKKK